MNIQALMQQANKMKREMEKKQAEIEATVFVSEAGGGAIKVEMKGNHQIEKITIDGDALNPEDKEMLEDMLKIAINDVNNQIDQALSAITAGFNMPGF